MRALAIIAVLLAASACVQTLTPERRLQIACSSYADTLSRLADRNRLGLVSAEAQGRVDRAVTIIAPICEARIPPSPAAVLARVEQALIVMIDERDRADVR